MIYFSFNIKFNNPLFTNNKMLLINFGLEDTGYVC